MQQRQSFERMLVLQYARTSSFASLLCSQAPSLCMIPVQITPIHALVTEPFPVCSVPICTENMILKALSPSPFNASPGAVYPRKANDARPCDLSIHALSPSKPFLNSPSSTGGGSLNGSYCYSSHLTADDMQRDEASTVGCDTDDLDLGTTCMS